MVPFRKMHGLGNDFIVLDARAGALPVTPTRAAAIADRHRGVGCDQLIVMEPAPPGADVFMRILNPDGSEAGACGNATRCIASLVAEEAGKDRVVVRTIAGDLPVERLPVWPDRSHSLGAQMATANHRMVAQHVSPATS